ncbi:MAG: hypothetical protein EA397_07305 [Deltaproteobacteria bacterium]|nr:MAG: hypothetical protein EA397_07305 [Deltaproteobacteria bacterium]
MRLLPLLLFAACTTATGGRQVAISAEVHVDAEVTERGGEPVIAFSPEGTEAEIVLTRAELAVGPLYLWTLPPDLDGENWASHLGPARAWATDQVNPGKLVGEVPHQVRVDFLADPIVPLGPGTAIEGEARSADVWLEPAGAEPTLRVEGEVHEIDQILPFRAEITWRTPWLDEEGGVNATLLRRVRGLPTELSLTDDQVIAVGIDPRAWFDLAFVDTLPDVPADEDARRTLRPQDRAGRALETRIRLLGSQGPWAVREAEL